MVMPQARRRTPPRPASRQRSFRLSERTLELLDDRASDLRTSSNSVAQRLLDEALRTDRHPLIYFRQGGSGVRRPALVGTRLDVWQVIETLRAEGNDLAAAVAYFETPVAQVQACVDYYAEFRDEVDAHAEAEREVARREEERWRKAQAALD